MSPHMCYPCLRSVHPASRGGNRKRRGAFEEKIKDEERREKREKEKKRSLPPFTGAAPVHPCTSRHSHIRASELQESEAPRVRREGYPFPRLRGRLGRGPLGSLGLGSLVFDLPVNTMDSCHHTLCASASQVPRFSNVRTMTSKTDSVR